MLCILEEEVVHMVHKPLNQVYGRGWEGSWKGEEVWNGYQHQYYYVHNINNVFYIMPISIIFASIYSLIIQLFWAIPPLQIIFCPLKSKLSLSLSRLAVPDLSVEKKHIHQIQNFLEIEKIEERWLIHSLNVYVRLSIQSWHDVHGACQKKQGLKSRDKKEVSPAF